MPAKLKKATCTFRNSGSDDCLSQFTKVSPLCDISEPIKVDISSRYYRDDSFIVEVVVVDDFFTPAVASAPAGSATERTSS